MTITIDRHIYDDACVSKCVYSCLDEVSIERTINGNNEVLTITPKTDTFSEDAFRLTFFECLNDYKLRNIIAEETKDIRTLLYAKAFMDCEDLNIE